MSVESQWLDRVVLAKAGIKDERNERKKKKNGLSAL